MLKLGEKPIYDFSDGFSIKGGKCSSSGKKLYITNLGNIIISSSDVSDENAERYIYSYSDYKVKISTRLVGDSIVVSEKEMPFIVYSGSSSKEVFVDFEFKMNVDDFSHINKNQREVIFEIDDDATFFVLNEKKIYSGGINRDHEKFTFVGGKNRFEIYYSDIEKYSVEGNMLTLKGYFHIERESIVARTVQIFNNNIKSVLPFGFKDMVLSNPKIGNLPEESKIAFGRVTGSISGFDYKSSNIFFVRYDDKIIIINKKNRKTIASFDEDEFSVIRNGNESIIFDGENVFSLYMNEKNRSVMRINRACPIENDSIGFTKSGNPFFITSDANGIHIRKDSDRNIMTIEDSKVSDINVMEDTGFEKYGYKKVKITFGNEFIEVFLRKNTINSIIRNVFVNSKERDVKDANMSEIFSNWSKSINDIVIYNFYARIYVMRRDMIKLLSGEFITDEIKINAVNKIYEDIMEIKKDIDIVSTYMSDFIKLPIEEFAGIKEVMSSKVYGYFDDIFSDMGYSIKDEIRDLELIIGNMSFVLSGEERRRHIFRMLKENESDRLGMFVEQLVEKLDHIVLNMYPGYIVNAEEKMYIIFKYLEKEFEKYEVEEIKKILFEKITQMYAFRHEKYISNSDERRSDIIEELKKIAYMSKQMPSSNWFFVGGMGNEK